VVQYGRKPATSLPLSWIQSFYDAPDGFNEEMHEIMVSVGLEYWYRQQFAIRAGYFNESENKGNRKYFAAGIGLKLNVFFIDFSYLISTSGRNNPLANTMRFTLGLNFDKL
jgi:long-subunit fatty acid transport protein